jgi:hypothetical protein
MKGESRITVVLPPPPHPGFGLGSRPYNSHPHVPRVMQESWVGCRDTVLRRGGKKRAAWGERRGALGWSLEKRGWS